MLFVLTRTNIRTDGRRRIYNRLFVSLEFSPNRTQLSSYVGDIAGNVKIFMQSESLILNDDE